MQTSDTPETLIQADDPLRDGAGYALGVAVCAGLWLAVAMGCAYVLWVAHG
jgi:hypothetical protein